MKRTLSHDEILNALLRSHPIPADPLLAHRVCERLKPPAAIEASADEFLDAFLRAPVPGGPPDLAAKVVRRLRVGRRWVFTRVVLPMAAGILLALGLVLTRPSPIPELVQGLPPIETAPSPDGLTAMVPPLGPTLDLGGSARNLGAVDRGIRAVSWPDPVMDELLLYADGLQGVRPLLHQPSLEALVFLAY